MLCRLPGSSCTDTAQPLGWPHTERQSSADSSMYRRVEYCRTVELWILSSMTLRRGIAGPVEVLSWQPQLPVKCRLEVGTTHLRDAFPPLQTRHSKQCTAHDLRHAPRLAEIKS